MPLYEYSCGDERCKHRWEEFQRVTELPLLLCPICGRKTAHRLIGKTTFRLRGVGWGADGYSEPKPVEKKKSD